MTLARASEPSIPDEPTFFVEAGPRRAVVGPVPARAIWRALRVGSIDFQTLARPSRDVAWRPLAYWLGEADSNAAAAAEFDDAAPTIVRAKPRPFLRSAPIVELDLEPDEEEDDDDVSVAAPPPRRATELPLPPGRRPSTAPPMGPARRPSSWSPPPPLAVTLRSMEELCESRSPSLAPAISPTLPPPAPRGRRGRTAVAVALSALVVAGAVSMSASPAARGQVASAARGAARTLEGLGSSPTIEGARATPESGDARTSTSSSSRAHDEDLHEDRDDELARALRRAETPPPPVIRVQDPCDGLAAGGKAICEWAGLVSVGAEARRPSFGAIQAFLAASRVRHASGVVLERIAATAEWPTHRVTVDWDHGYCLAAPDDRFGPGQEWAAWVVVRPQVRASDRCLPAETADFVGPLLELHERPVGPGAAALALRVRKELAAFAERHPADG